MSLKEKLPSKKFMLIAGVIILALVVFFVSKALFGGVEGYVKKNKETEAKSVPLGSVIYKDSDGDGLWDWEEALWGTDPDNPDTNGDGIGDKEEVDARRPSTGEDQGDETETSLLAREFFSAIISLNQNGLLTEANLAEIANSLSQTIKKDGAYEAYSFDSLTVVPTNIENTQAYKNSVQQILLTYSDPLLGEELSIIPQYLQDPEDHQSSLEDIVSSYRELAAKLVLVPVPQQVSLTHLSLLNNLDRVAFAIEEMLYLKDDPVRGVSGVSYYETYSTSLEQDLTLLNSYLTQF